MSMDETHQGQSQQQKEHPSSHGAALPGAGVLAIKPNTHQPINEMLQ